MDVQTDRVSALRASLPEQHVIATLMDEHQRILANLSRLAALVAPETCDPDDPRQRKDLQKIVELATRLIAAEPHHQREEQVLFPALRERGVTGPTMVMEAEHVELRSIKHGLHDAGEELLATGSGSWTALRRKALNLVDFLREHISKEDQVLYPMAIQVIDDASVWDELKARCDTIGYCCHGPHDA